MKTKLIAAAISLLSAGPALAGGWSDAEVRGAAEGPEWTAKTPVASMPKPDRSNPMPMGVEEYGQPTVSTLAAEVAGWEANKERHGHKVELDDKVWDASPSKTMTVEYGRQVGAAKHKGLVHEIDEQADVGAHNHHARHHHPHEKTLIEERGGDVGYGPIIRIHDALPHGAAGRLQDPRPDRQHRRHSHEGHQEDGPHVERILIDVDLSGSGQGWAGR